ncbi:MAG TPA: hypothetical protein VF191_02310 [Cyclobacteriaceae bacterium]
MTFRYRTIIVSGCQLSLVLILISSLTLMADQQRSEFRGPASRTTHDGHVRLQWRAVMPNAMYEVQQSATPDFERAMTIYQGPDLATFVSGLPNGIYYYRLRSNGGGWSGTVTVTVEHYSLQLAFTLAGLGAIVFLLTVALVVKGTAKATQ